MQRWLTASARSAVRKPPFEYLSIVMPAASRSAILVLIASPFSLICHELIAGMPLVVRVIAGATTHALKCVASSGGDRANTAGPAASSQQEPPREPQTPAQRRVMLHREARDACTVSVQAKASDRVARRQHANSADSAGQCGSERQSWCNIARGRHAPCGALP